MSKIDGFSSSPQINSAPNADIIVPEKSLPSLTLLNSENADAKKVDFKNIGDFFRDKIKNIFDEIFAPQTLSKEATVTKVGERVIIQTGAKNDQIGVRQDAATGNITVTVNGESQIFSGTDKDNLVIRAGNGNDVITVDRNVTVNLVLEGEGGNDTLTGGSGNDTVRGGDGRDFINGTLGNDALFGDKGNDVIYGGGGNDSIQGNDGDDYLEGSRGNDNLNGGAGKDVLSGGMDNDNLDGGLDDDTLYAGSGKDNLIGGAGTNKLFAQTEDTTQKSDKRAKINNTVVTIDLSEAIGSTLKVEGTPEFIEIVEADLEMFRSSRIGRGMLESFDESGKTVIIRQTTGGDSATFVDRDVPGKPQPWYDPATNTKGSPVDGFVNYNPQAITLGTTEFQPSVKFFHELGHNYDYTQGTLRPGTYTGDDKKDNGMNNRERVATGLPIDHDNNPKTAEIIDPLHPKKFTENGLREEMGLPKREHYAL